MSPVASMMPRSQVASPDGQHQGAAQEIFNETETMTNLSFSKLMLSEFRSYRQVSLSLDPRPVVLTGPNGAGKTNILEALSLFAPGRGLRSAKMSELTHANGHASEAILGNTPSPKWAVSGTLNHAQVTTVLGTGLGEGAGGESKRLVRIDGEHGTGPSQFCDYLSIVWLTPAMDRMFNELLLTVTQLRMRARAAGKGY